MPNKIIKLIHIQYMDSVVESKTCAISYWFTLGTTRVAERPDPTNAGWGVLRTNPQKLRMILKKEPLGVNTIQFSPQHSTECEHGEESQLPQVPTVVAFPTQSYTRY